MTLEEAESKLTAIAKLPEKWRKNRAEPWELIQDLEAALGSLPMEPVPEVPADPLPAGKLSDEQLGVIGLRAANSCNHQVKFYENFARAVREAVEKECNRSMQNGLYQAIVNKLKPILGENSRELEWDILPFTLGKLIAAKRIPDAGQAKKIGEQAEEIARLTAKSEEMCQAFVAEAAKKHEALAIIEQAIEMVNTPGTIKENLPNAINAKIMQRDEFHDATLKKLDAAKEDIARLLKLDATNRENCDRTHKALVESQLLQLETQKALAKANSELERLRWRPVSVKPTIEDASIAGYVETCHSDRDCGRYKVIAYPWEGEEITHWRPFCPPPAPTSEEVERAEMQKAWEYSMTQSWHDVKQALSYEAFSWGWKLARAAKEGEK